jgi:hypothetical protein
MQTSDNKIVRQVSRSISEIAKVMTWLEHRASNTRDLLVEMNPVDTESERLVSSSFQTIWNVSEQQLESLSRRSGSSSSRPSKRRKFDNSMITVRSVYQKLIKS